MRWFKRIETLLLSHHKAYSRCDQYLVQHQLLIQCGAESGACELGLWHAFAARPDLAGPGVRAGARVPL